MNPNDRKSHARTKTTLKIIGLLLMAGGAALAVTGFADIFTSDGFPTKFWMLMLGLPMLAIGGMLTLTGFRQEIGRYMKNETAPIFNEMSRDIRPGVQDIASAVQQGMSRPADAQEQTQGVPSGEGSCPACGASLPQDSRFCPKCGRPLARSCPHCGETLPPDAKFCPACGKPLGTQGGAGAADGGNGRAGQ